jgi:hypothetical protein
MKLKGAQNNVEERALVVTAVQYLAGEREKSPLCVWFWGERVSSSDFIITLGRAPLREPEREGGEEMGTEREQRGWDVREREGDREGEGYDQNRDNNG